MEKFGYNKLAGELSNIIINRINDNFGKLLLNKNISIKSSIGKTGDILFNNDIINIKINNRTYGNMNPGGIIFSNKSIDNLVINLEVELSSNEFLSKKLSMDNELVNTIEHESLHIIERYLTFINGGEFSKSWEMGEKLQQLSNKYNSDIWEEISYFIYLSLPHEMRARLQQLNSDIKSKGLSGITNVDNYIKTTKIYKDVEFLSKINTQKVIDKLKMDKNHINIIEDFSNIFLENNNNNIEKNFIDYIKNIKMKNEKLLEKLHKVSYNFENINIDMNINYNKYK